MKCPTCGLPNGHLSNFYILSRDLIINAILALHPDHFYLLGNKEMMDMFWALIDVNVHNHKSWNKDQLRKRYSDDELLRFYEAIKGESDGKPIGMLIYNYQGIGEDGRDLPCDGRSLKIKDYPKLYEVIGRNYTRSSITKDIFQLPNYDYCWIYIGESDIDDNCFQLPSNDNIKPQDTED